MLRISTLSLSLSLSLLSLRLPTHSRPVDNNITSVSLSVLFGKEETSRFLSIIECDTHSAQRHTHTHTQLKIWIEKHRNGERAEKRPNENIVFRKISNNNTSYSVFFCHGSWLFAAVVFHRLFIHFSLTNKVYESLVRTCVLCIVALFSLSKYYTHYVFSLCVCVVESFLWYYCMESMTFFFLPSLLMLLIEPTRERKKHEATTTTTITRKIYDKIKSERARGANGKWKY